MTTTRSPRKIASEIECVISTTVLPLACQIRCSSRFIRSRVKRIQRAEWLVHQQDARIAGQRPADAGALLHAARELVGIAVAEIGEAGHRQQRVDIVARGAVAPPTRSGSATLSRTVSHGSRLAAWNTTPTSRDGPRYRRPSSGRRRRRVVECRRGCAAACSCRSRTGRRQQTNSPSAMSRSTRPARARCLRMPSCRSSRRRAS